MKLRIRYFGMVADRLGRQAETVEWEGTDPVDLRPWLLELHPELAVLSWKVAVDQEIVEGVCRLSEASEIVVLPPFAGG